MRKFKPTGIEKFDTALMLLDNHLMFTSKEDHTRSSYCCRVRNFILFANKLPEECTKNELIKTVLLLRKSRNLSQGTMKIYIYSIKYYLFNVAERMDLWAKIPNPKLRGYEFESLTIAEIKNLMKACCNPKEKIIIQLLYETGIRVGELIKLRLSDFDFHNNSLCIRKSKNRKTRIVYFGKQFIEVFNEYYNSSKSLFSSSQSNYEFHRLLPFSKRSIRNTIRKIASKSGTTKKVIPHSFRHAFAVHYLNFGGTIFQLQKLLGHSHLVTTCEYLKYAILPESLNISVLDKLTESKVHHKLNLKRA